MGGGIAFQKEGWQEYYQSIQPPMSSQNRQNRLRLMKFKHIVATAGPKYPSQQDGQILDCHLVFLVSFFCGWLNLVT